jgi:hypothetical protein
MQYQGTFAAIQQQVFCAARYRIDFQAAQDFRNIRGNRPAQIRVAYRDIGNMASFQMRRDTPADDFDFREFRH